MANTGILTFIVLLAAMRVTEAQPTNASREAAAVRSARDSQNKAIAARDFDRMASFWAPDVEIRASLGRVLRGRDEYRTALSADTALIYRRGPDLVDVASNEKWPLAFESGSWSGRRSANSAPIIRGRYAAQWIRMNGRWLIRSEVFVMNEVIEPAADRYWEAVGTVTDKNGTVEKAPKTDEEWPGRNQCGNDAHARDPEPAARHTEPVGSLAPSAASTRLIAMSRLRVGVVRYASAATAIAQALGVDPAPECRIGAGRITVTFRRIGASRWPEDRQVEHAIRAVAIARAVLADDPRRAVRERATRAIAVVYEDATSVLGCAVTARWECVVPAAMGL
jgi:ketosteroid isomerase-like protein